MPQLRSGTAKKINALINILKKKSSKYGLHWWLNGKESTYNAGTTGDTVSIFESGRTPRGSHDNALLVFLPRESHGQRILAGYSP